MKMKKWAVLMLVLGLMNIASAGLVTLVPITEGAPGSATNPLHGSDSITILVTTDIALLSLDTVLTVTGPGTITDAMKPGDCVPYGWDLYLSFDPIITPKMAEIGAADFDGSGLGVVGYFKLHCDGPSIITVTLAPAYDLIGGPIELDSGNEPTVSGSLTIYEAPPEPTCWDATQCAGQTLLGDATCDGKVNAADLVKLKQSWLKSKGQVGYNCCADFDHNGKIGSPDLVRLKQNWLKSGLFPATGNQSCPP
jgi:hypothetical protein